MPLACGLRSCVKSGVGFLPPVKTTRLMMALSSSSYLVTTCPKEVVPLGTSDSAKGAVWAEPSER